MRVKKSTEPRDSDGASDQKQDPLERRRLQNRLSQRNHRRKIRDRIAKLQERVIANELRAAAALNGWDQPHTPLPLLGPRHVFQQDTGLGNGNADTSPSMIEPFSNFGSSYGFSMTSSWPSSAAQSSTILSADSTWLWNFVSSPTEAAYPNSTIYDLMSDGVNQSFLESGEGQSIPDLSNTGSPHSSGSFATPANQPLYYTVTETALPQILQVLSTASPQSKIIVLVSTDTVSTGMEYPVTASSLLENTVLQDFPQHMGSAQSAMCQCQSQSMAPALTASMGSREWVNRPSSYMAGCPSKISNTVGGGLSNARV